MVRLMAIINNYPFSRSQFHHQAKSYHRQVSVVVMKLDGIVGGMKDGEWSDLKRYSKCTKLPNCTESSKYSVPSKTSHVVFVIKLLLILCKCMLSRRNDTNWSLVGEMRR